MLAEVYFENATLIFPTATALPNEGPGVAAALEPAPSVIVAPSPQIPLGYRGTHLEMPPFGLPYGTYYALVGMAGDATEWYLNAPRSTVVATGPTNLVWGAEMDGDPYAEANVAIVGASATLGERTLTFEITGTVTGFFGVPAFALVGGASGSYESGEAWLTLPNGTDVPCWCSSSGSYLPGFIPRNMPGTYVYHDNRTMITQLRTPPAVWIDVPPPFG